MIGQITLEYPEGQRSAEMLLVEMLGEKRSWNNRMEIVKTLSRLRQDAESMQKERAMLNQDDNVCEAGPA